MSPSPDQTTATHAPRPTWLGDALTMLALTLLAFGVVMVYSSSSIRMELKTSDATVYLRRQLLWVTLAGIVFILARATEAAQLRRLAPLLFWGTVALLVLVLIPGVSRDIKGARRWLSFGGMNFQPSELAKLAMIVQLAMLLELRRDRLGDFRQGFLKIIVPIALLAGLVIVEPDFGSALLLSAVGGAMLLVAGARLRHLLLLAGPGAVALVMLVLYKGAHVRQRLEAFFDPSADPNGVSYQVRQAIIALGSGGLWGQGLGASKQKRLFLPDVHTDFIFALVGEELGFVGAVVMILLYAALLGLGFYAALKARDRFSSYVAFGIVLCFGLQTCINIAVATGSVPPKGIALPLVSFGGSSLILCAASLGLLVNIANSGRVATEIPVSAAPSRGEVVRHGRDVPA